MLGGVFFMTMWAALLIVLAVFAFGDFMGVITKAKVPSLFVFMCSIIVVISLDTLTGWDNLY